MHMKRISIPVIAISVAVAAALLSRLGSTASPGLDEFGSRPSLIDRAAVQAGGPPKDAIPALTDPAFLAAENAAYLDPDDLVIGLQVNGEARAYPLRILVWHELINDTIAGRPVLVTYCPLCHSAMVFDRQVGGSVREFGVSGLLYNSNVLLYDRQPRDRDSSLWSQAEMRAVIGPAAKEQLTLDLLPADLTSWHDWRSRHPTTRVLSEETGHARNYRRTAYASYFAHDQLMFNAETRTARPPGFRMKEPMVAVYAGETAKAYAFKDVAAAGGEDGIVQDTLGTRRITLTSIDGGKSVRVAPADEGPPLKVAYLYWFSLSASTPDVEIYRP